MSSAAARSQLYCLGRLYRFSASLSLSYFFGTRCRLYSVDRSSSTMFAAKCFRLVSLKVSLNGVVPSAISPEFSSSQLRIGSLNAVQFHRRTSATDDSVKGTASSPSSVASRTVKHHATPPKLTWPRHPHHRLPSAWPYADLSVTTTAEARGVVVRLDDHGRALLTEELKKFEDEKASVAGNAFSSVTIFSAPKYKLQYWTTITQSVNQLL